MSSPIMLPTTERGSRAYQHKPDFHLYDQLKASDTNACSTERTWEWVNNIPEVSPSLVPRKRKAFEELQNNRVLRPRMASRQTTKKGKQGGKKGEELGEEAAQCQPTQRATRSATRVVPAMRRALLDEDGDCSVEGGSSGPPDLVGARDFVPVLLPYPSLGNPSQSHGSSSPTKSGSQGVRSTSPSKRITVDRLRSFNPEMRFSSYGDARQKKLLTLPVQTLWLKLVESCGPDSPSIPLGLQEHVKHALDTPQKSRLQPPQYAYMNDYSIYSQSDEDKISMSVSDIFQQAERWRDTDAQEPHWCDQVVSPLLNLVRKLDCSNAEVSEHKPCAATLNISSTEIQPPALYPMPVNRDVFKALNKKIDYAMGLLLPDEDIKYLERGTYSMSPAISSINQTDGFTRFIPMFLNVEVKRQDPNSDAKVQLAVWVTAEFKKRAEEGYDRNMPVLAVAVYGDDWSLWIAYEPSPEKESPVQEISFLGPIQMGSTTTMHGIFTILRYLVTIVDWGRTEYYKWFRESVLQLYRPVTAG